MTNKPRPMKHEATSRRADPGDSRPAAGLTVGELRELTRAVVKEELSELLATLPGLLAQPALIDQTTLAKHLGVSARTVYEMRGNGLPTVIVGESPRFILADVIAWLRQGGELTSEFDVDAAGAITRKLKDGRRAPATKAELKAALGSFKLGK